MPAVTRERAIRREQMVERCIPYAAHVAEHVVRLESGDYVQVFRLGGASFESADDVQLNNWHERLNVLWKNLASPNVAIWTHLIRRRETGTGLALAPAEAIPPIFFSDALVAKYQQRLAGETLMVNELYLAFVYRPASGIATHVAAKAITRGRRGGSRLELLDALDACEKLAQTF